MATNKSRKSEVEEKEELAAEEPVAPRRRSSGSSRSVWKKLNVFDWFDRNQIANNMPYILFLTLLVMFYIANSYYAERIIREIDKTKTEMKEKSAEFISTRSQLMYKSKQSEVADAVEMMGLNESVEPPQKLTIPAPAEKK
ncbi:MAG: hypothetical protein RIQ47_780 [Bacteroidota bacterium]|jgi:hypothetical protein